MHKFENFFVSVDLICYLKLIYLTNDIYVNFAFNLRKRFNETFYEFAAIFSLVITYINIHF